jgi:hypothetical protein
MQNEAVISPKKSITPALALIVLSPVIAELLSGATRLSTIFALIPEMMVWGCGTLLIRETARRRGLGWSALLLMGLGLSIAEEFIIQQTSLAPLPWLKTSSMYGRALGVNWIYFLFMLGFESVWVVLVPIQVTEFIFRERRTEPWLRMRGFVVTAVVFILGSRIAWYGWIKRVRPMVFHVPPYHPPALTILSGALAIVFLVLASLNLRPRGPSASVATPPAPGAVGVITFALGLPWYGIIILAFTSTSKLTALPFWIPMIGGIAWAGMVFLIIRRWSSSVGWRDVHRYALTFGAMLVPMVGGFAGSNLWPRIDLIGKSVLDVIAVLLLIALGRVVRTTRGSTG